MNGRRVYHFDGHQQLMSGEYGKWHDTWYAITPNGHTATLDSNDVTEHADGMITVSGSIAVSTSVKGQKVQVYHGYLEHGAWRQAA